MLDVARPRSELEYDPLECAVRGLNLAAVDLLLARGFDPNQYTDEVVPPTDAFREVSRYPDRTARRDFEAIFRRLLDAGLDPCWSYLVEWRTGGAEPDGSRAERTVAEGTAYEMAVAHHEIAAIELFEEVGADCTARRIPQNPGSTDGAVGRVRVRGAVHLEASDLSRNGGTE